MESKNKSTMCRLCLCENESFFYIFGLNDQQGCVPAEVISDLLQFQVSETDAYPHVVCSTCLTKLTDFKLFKECCQKSKVVYDDMFDSSETLVKHDSEAEASLAGGGVKLFDGDPLKDTSFHKSCHAVSDLQLYERDPLRDASCDEACHDGSDLDPLGDISHDYDVKPIKLELEDEDVDSTEVRHTAVDMVTHSHHLQSLEHDTPNSTSIGGVGAHLCSRNITTNDDSIFEDSKNISSNINIEASSSGRMDRLERQQISPGEGVHTAPFIEEDNIVSLEMDGGKKEKDMGGEMEEGTGAAPGKGLEGERKLLECFQCGSMLMTKSSLIKHIMLHGFGHCYDCNVCGKTFPSKYGLTRHALVHTDSKEYKCEECSQCFTQNCHLKKHMRVHTGSKPYKCAECSKCFSNNGNLTQHKRSHSGSKPYKCTDCSKCFTQNYHLKNHMRLHTGSKLHECAECSQCFTQNCDLKRHMKTHTGYKPYKCAECSKCFRGNGYLKVHMRIHTGSKPYKCGTCSKRFISNGSLKIHLLVHTKEKPFECHGCGTRFRRSGSLNKHLERRCKEGIE